MKLIDIVKWCSLIEKGQDPDACEQGDQPLFSPQVLVSWNPTFDGENPSDAENGAPHSFKFTVANLLVLSREFSGMIHKNY